MHWSDPSQPSQSSASSVVEHLTFNQGVVSSSLTRGTTPYFLTLPPRASKQHLPEAEIASGFSFPDRRFGEMVAARDLKSLEAIPHAGSSPATGTSEFTRLFGKKCRFFFVNVGKGVLSHSNPNRHDFRAKWRKDDMTKDGAG